MIGKNEGGIDCMKEQKTDILIVGASTGGCAAALAAASMGLQVILTEETDWIGGQLTSQAIPPDEHPWIEKFGCTQRYRRYRDGVRQYYRDHYPLLPAVRRDPYFNPGGGWVSPICHEFRVGLAVLNQMFAYPRSRGLVHTMLRCKPVAAETNGDTIRSVTVENLDTRDQTVLSAPFILDATELGDLLALAKVEYVTGAESQSQTGEPHAVAGEPQPDNLQSISWCFVMGYDPGGQYLIDKPEQYSFWRDYNPQLNPPWPGNMLSFTQTHPITVQPYTRVLFLEDAKTLTDSIFEFRKIINKAHYPAGVMPHEATLVNWPQLDYVESSIIDKPEQEVQNHLHAAKQQAISLFYWLQTEAPRPDGGVGYPGLYLVPEITGTHDGFAKYPYIREARRIRAEFTITELHVGHDARNSNQAEFFEDSVGVGSYRIDLHPSTGRDNYIDVSSLPFQIPLGALIPIRVENLLPACKNIGTTHITNGCYRLHPVEWNIGESAGSLAAFCLLRGLKPRQVYQKKELFSEFQALLHSHGVETAWPSPNPI
jgi:hypothetical protein